MCMEYSNIQAEPVDVMKKLNDKMDIIIQSLERIEEKIKDNTNQIHNIQFRLP